MATPFGAGKWSVNLDGLLESPQKAVTPAKAGVQNFLVFLDSGFRRKDRKRGLLASYKAINFDYYPITHFIHSVRAIS